MMPPRLTVVQGEGAQDATPDDAGSPSGQHDRPASPVHDLIASLAAAPVPQPTPDAGATADRRELLRILEAVIFAAAEPQAEDRLRSHLPAGSDVAGLLAELQASYATRGVNLVKVGGKWTFRTAEDLSWLLERRTQDERRLSKAALETLAIIAYHQPVTRAEIEDVRGVTISKGTLDVLMESGWVRPRGRRRAPGKPVTYGTTERFLQHFGLDTIRDLPGLAELKGSGLLDANLPPDFKVPEPTDVAALLPDELPLDATDSENDDQSELDLESESEGAEPEADDEPDDGTPHAES